MLTQRNGRASSLAITARVLACVVLLAPASHARQNARPRPAPTTDAKHAGATTTTAPLSKSYLLGALRRGRPAKGELVRLVKRRGVSFELTADDESRLRSAGATPALLEALRADYRPPRLPVPVNIQMDPSLYKVDRNETVPPKSPSGGVGTGSGTGGGVGVGDGAGVGYGPGSGNNVGGSGGIGVEGEVDYTRPFRPTEVTRKAVINEKPAPGFTEEARKNDVEGTVRLRAVLSAAGSVQGISVVKGLPDGLTEMAIAAARQIRFTPAQKDGRAVSQYVTLEYYFNFYYDEDDVTKRAVILEKPAPEYTAEARRNGVSGKVVLKVLLMKGGGVSIMSVEQSLPDGLTQKASEAAQLIKFTPAERDGRAVTQLATIEYDFKP